MSLLEEFGLLYLSGSLPHWWYRVWGCVTTVPLYKTLEMDAVRPVGVRNPLIRTLHSRVIRDNRATFAAVLEPQQLALSLAGGHKLVHQVRSHLTRSAAVIRLVYHASSKTAITATA